MRVLSDSVVKQLLNKLSRDELCSYQSALASALLEFQKDPSIIPQRIVTLNKVTQSTHLFMASVGATAGMKALTGSKAGFKGVTSILDPTSGELIGLVNALTLTAFRTALATTLPLIKTFPIDNLDALRGSELMCIGVGPQGYWHVKNALLLYPDCFTKIHVVNRSVDKAQTFADNLSQELKELDNIELNVFGLGDTESFKKAMTNTSVVFTCIPTTQSTINKDRVSTCQQPKVFIGAIGSYKPHMIEIDGDILKELVLEKGGRVIVDSKEHALEEAGELIMNDIGSDSLAEIAELFTEEGSEMVEWMQSPDTKFVVSKIVGLCIMDVAAGQSVLDTAEREAVGVEIDF